MVSEWLLESTWWGGYLPIMTISYLFIFIIIFDIIIILLYLIIILGGGGQLPGLLAPKLLGSRMAPNTDQFKLQLLI